MSKPDIDDLIRSHRYGDLSSIEFKQALYHRLAAEAVEVQRLNNTLVIKAIPISKLKAIMEIKES